MKVLGKLNLPPHNQSVNLKIFAVKFLHLFYFVVTCIQLQKVHPENWARAFLRFNQMYFCLVVGIELFKKTAPKY